MAETIVDILRRLEVREMTLGDFPLVAEGTSVGEVCVLLESRGRSAAVVEKEGRVTGIFTQRDLLYRTADGVLDLDAPIETVMTREPRTFHAERPLAEALATMMEGGFRQLPLVDDGERPRGLLTIRDVLTFIARRFPRRPSTCLHASIRCWPRRRAPEMRCPFCGSDNIQGSELCESCGAELAGLDIPEAGDGVGGRLLTDRVADLELSPALTLPPAASVADALALMRRERHGCVLVVEEGVLCGIFTERDVLSRLVLARRDATATPLSAVMTPDPVRLEAGDPPAFAIHSMVARGLRHLPVLSGAQLLGFVSVRNILRYLRQDLLA
ncbi:MAG: CBS domain-containing protein [Thermoanaerobaculia bacterium]